MMICRRQLSGLRATVLAFAALGGIGVASARQVTPAAPLAPAVAPESAGLPRHLADAETLISELPAATVNVYAKSAEKKDYIDWNPDRPAARTVCSTFASLLIAHTYGYSPRQIKEWMRSSSPTAAEVYEAIVSRRGFERIVHIDKVKPGDFITIKYRDTSKDTGHVMLVDSAPAPQNASEPLIDGTTQYSVTVIDSSASGHGPSDTRHRGSGEGFTGGIGRGTIRLYAASDGHVVGYAWSESKKSKYETAPERDLAVGRLTKAAETFDTQKNVAR